MVTFNEFKRWDVSEQLNYLEGNDFITVIEDDYFFERTSSLWLDNEINSAVTESTEGWRDLMSLLSDLENVIDTCEYVYREYNYDGPFEYKELTSEVLASIVREYSNYEEYPFKDGIDTDGLDDLLKVL